ncbi:symmetrical bis(5'-nucleosyl)-tetraphosphatase [Ketobacter sp. MCCC 1A13808]|uniref:symmetrical bis(5'-nucleosyl)-tetraphosphatase n=1 Tax=Ketobacter sp. MCCC 1A13808 TaxID=2602738 RepID=UPI000F1913EB|nr:symmetrical bis(5'-nucleosyl)-tetraphosphatase [Ketobacter sp. MCCC 1A13808]MVF13099.1 symmetrical bis(5'-nucleosyl)-tetraphosphatase [Ketobacter sp. MCCC 1A13808]RLP52993.1 MAG: symmetrical bis(5'-nucleosyl)-tetraphosphatase [Ketobacter sp.]
MATYAIGDLQGCFKPFKCLLDEVKFNPDQDQIWLCGDLVNRGPESLKTLKFCYDRRDNLIAVLGNHDLHMLAVLAGIGSPKRKDTFNDVLASKHRDKLTDWLLSCPLMHENDDWVMSHAGIYPGWSLQQARKCAREVETVLQNPQLRLQYFENMYGNTPAIWDESLTGPDRWRTITNFFTRMRLVNGDGEIDLTHKEALSDAPAGLIPWFQWPQRTPLKKKILFGHWAALQGVSNYPGVLALDTGCVWGNRLTAVCLETEALTSCDCEKS